MKEFSNILVSIPMVYNISAYCLWEEPCTGHEMDTQVHGSLQDTTLITVPDEVRCDHCLARTDFHPLDAINESSAFT